MDKRSSKRTGSQQHETSINDATVDPAVAAALATQQQTFQTIIDAQLKTFQACLQACMDATNNRIDTFVRETITDITELKASLQYTQKEVSEMKQNVTTNHDQRVAADRLLQKLDADVKRVDDTADYLENQSRRNNLRVDGVKETPGETWEDTEAALRQVAQRELKLPAEQVDALQIERAHRTGATTAQRDRTIVAKFLSFKERDAIIRAARTVKPRGVYVNEDYSQRNERSARKRQCSVPGIRQARCQR